ncbi:MAG: hypothetical protein ACRDD1_21700, partial [Planctomycetia bacterium]
LMGGFDDDRDLVTGGGGQDRFLLAIEDATRDDNRSDDARLNFRDGRGAWTDAEVELMDQGLELLLRRTGDIEILRRSNGVDMTYIRENASGDGTFAQNDENGTLRFFSESFAEGPSIAVDTMVHEMGHNWDDPEEMGNARFDNFLELSGWTQTEPVDSRNFFQSEDERWFYLQSATFAPILGPDDKFYGRTNPFEDWSSVWESYFQIFRASGQEGVNNGSGRDFQQKIVFVDQFFSNFG